MHQHVISEVLISSFAHIVHNIIKHIQIIAYLLSFLHPGYIFAGPIQAKPHFHLLLVFIVV